MSEERYYVREQRIYGANTWFIRDRLYCCRNIYTLRGGCHPTSAARNRGAVNGLAIRLNKEYEEWLQQPSV